MYEEVDQLDDELASLAAAVREGAHVLACLRLAELTLKLDHRIRSEERALVAIAARLEVAAPRAIAKIRGEHASLRRLVAAIAAALDAADVVRALERIGQLRSVFLLHVTKEARLQPSVPAPHP